MLHSLLLLSSDLKVDLAAALEQKLTKDAAKYPVEKAKGKNLKYTGCRVARRALQCLCTSSGAAGGVAGNRAHP